MGEDVIWMRAPATVSTIRPRRSFDMGSDTRAMLPSISRSLTSLEASLRRKYVNAALLSPPASTPTTTASSSVKAPPVPSHSETNPVAPKKVATKARLLSGMTVNTPDSPSTSPPASISASPPLKTNHNSRGAPAASMKAYSQVMARPPSRLSQCLARNCRLARASR